MKKENPNKTYTNKEIGAALNNAVVCTLGSQALKGITEARKKKLRDYTSVIVDTVLDFRKKEDMTAEELVYVFSVCTLFFQALMVSKNGVRLPMFEDIAARMIKDGE